MICDMTNEKPIRAIPGMPLPVMAGNLFQQCCAMTDAVITVAVAAYTAAAVILVYFYRRKIRKVEKEFGLCAIEQKKGFGKS